MADARLESVKKMLRSCLLPEREGVPVHRINRIYEELVQEPIPFAAYKFPNAEQFILKMMPDAARLTTNSLGERVFVAIVTEDTRHIAQLVSRQKKPKKSKKKAVRPIHPRRAIAQGRGHFPSSLGVAHHITYHITPVHGHTVHAAPAPPPNLRASAHWHSTKPATPSLMSIRVNRSPRHSPVPPAQPPVPPPQPPVSTVTSAQRPSNDFSAAHGRMPDSNGTTQPSKSRSRGHDFRDRSNDVDVVRRPGRGSPTFICTLPLNPPPTASTSSSSHSLTDGVYRPPSPPCDENSQDPVCYMREDLRQKLGRLRLTSTDMSSQERSIGTARNEVASPPSESRQTVDYTNLNEIKIWLRKVVDGKKSGLWSSYLDDEYRKTFGRSPPHPFAELAPLCSDVVRLESFGTRYIVYPQDELNYIDANDDSMRLFTLESSVASKVVSAPVDYPVEPDEIKLPEEASFCVYVSHICTPSEICVRIVGEEYSNKLEELEAQLQTAKGPKIRNPEPEMVCVAFIETEMDDESVEAMHFRVRILSVKDDNQVEVLLLDHFGFETVPLDRLFVLPPKYNRLPYQAIKCGMAQLEEFTDTEDTFMFDKMSALVLGKACDATIVSRNPNLLLTLINHDTKVNINSALLTVLLSPRIPKVNETSKCGVSYVDADGSIFLQFYGYGLDRLKHLMETHLLGSTFTASKRKRPSKVKCNELYAVMSSFSDEWSRASVCEFVSTGTKSMQQPTSQVKVRFIDYGDWEIVDVGSVYLLPLHDLVTLPPQAVQCALTDLPPVGKEWNQDVANFILTMTDGLETTVKVLSMDPLTVDIYLANDGLSLTARLLENEKIWNGPEPMPASALVLPPPVDLVNGENVHVSWVDDPSNFRVIPMRFSEDLRIMMNEMQSFYSKLCSQKLMMVTQPVVGEMYAVFHDDLWYRAVVRNVIPKEVLASSVGVKFVDFGDHSVSKVDRLLLLPAQFRKLPMLAVTARLAGVIPCGSSWSEQEKREFAALTLDQTLTVYIKPSLLPSPPGLEHCVDVTLIQSVDGRFVFIHSILVNRGLAQRLN